MFEQRENRRRLRLDCDAVSAARTHHPRAVVEHEFALVEHHGVLRRQNLPFFAVTHIGRFIAHQHTQHSPLQIEIGEVPLERGVILDGSAQIVRRRHARGYERVALRGVIGRQIHMALERWRDFQGSNCGGRSMLGSQESRSFRRQH